MPDRHRVLFRVMSSIFLREVIVYFFQMAEIKAVIKNKKTAKEAKMKKRMIVVLMAAAFVAGSSAHVFAEDVKCKVEKVEGTKVTLDCGAGATVMTVEGEVKVVFQAMTEAKPKMESEVKPMAESEAKPKVEKKKKAIEGC